MTKGLSPSLIRLPNASDDEWFVAVMEQMWSIILHSYQSTSWPEIYSSNCRKAFLVFLLARNHNIGTQKCIIVVVINCVSVVFIFSDKLVNIVCGC